MTRHASISILFAFAACDLGEVPPVGGVTDAATGTDGSAVLACIDRGTPGQAHIHATGGTSNQGQACMGAGCHIVGGTGPLFGAMGTVYKADGVTPNPGAAVRISYGGMTKVAITDSDGNFTFSETLTTQVTFPSKTDASGCPTDPVHMVTPLGTAADMNCNRGGCHDVQTNRINFE